MKWFEPNPAGKEAAVLQELVSMITKPAKNVTEMKTLMVELDTRCRRVIDPNRQISELH